MKGELLDSASLKEVMHERHQRLKVAKAREQELAQRSSGSKRRGGNDGGSVDVFKRNTKRR